MLGVVPEVAGGVVKKSAGGVVKLAGGVVKKSAGGVVKLAGGGVKEPEPGGGLVKPSGGEEEPGGEEELGVREANGGPVAAASSGVGKLAKKSVNAASTASLSCDRAR